MPDNKPHFDISASVIRQLGEELVTDEVTAIMELIKNSYDADADWVKVEVNLNDYYSGQNSFYKNSPPGYILIEDNGFGMSDDDIWNSWMKISLSFKKKFKEQGLETPKGRTPLGEKGVGRLSTQRLGSRLEMFTGKAGLTKTNHVAFDWDQFDDDTSLTSVPVYLNSFPKPLADKGTSLVITNLKESNKWKGESWDRFRGQISQMIFPFKEKRIFNVYLKLNGHSVDLDEVNQKIRDNSVAKYTFELKGNKLSLYGEIKLQKLSGGNKKDDLIFFQNKILPDFGKDFFNYLTDAKENKKQFVSNIIYSDKPNAFISFHREIDFNKLSNIALDEVDTEGKKIVQIAHPGDFQGEIDDFYFKESEEIESAFDSLSEFKRLVQNQIGVRLFRDGFGIKPYGIDGQDWLKLSGNQTSGGSYYGLRPGNVIGYVLISAKDNKNLKEKTDREGFVDSPYSRNFFRVLKYFVEEINSILENTRRSYSDYRGKKGKESGGIQSISDSFNKIRKTSERASVISNRTKTIRFNLSNIANRIEEITEKEKGNDHQNNDVNILLNTLTNLLRDTESLFIEVENILDEAKILDQHVEFLQPQIQNLEQQLSDFSQLAGLGLTAEALTHELSNIVDRVLEETERISTKIRSQNALDQNSIKIYIEYIKGASRSFRKQLSHLTPSLRYVREVIDDINVTDFLKEVKDYYQDRFHEEIDVNLNISGNGFHLKMNKGKLTQVIDNLMLNSEYWLLEKKKSEPSFKPVITIEAQEPFVKIHDNGNGVEPNLQDQIFQPFITGKPKNVGRGLGLFIVQQLLESDGCDLMLLTTKNIYGRKYIFQLNMSNVIET